MKSGVATSKTRPLEVAFNGERKYSALPPEFDAFYPLGSRPIWAPYTLLPGENGRNKKPPVDPATGELLRWRDRTKFWTFSEAMAAAKRLKLPGVGLFTGGDVGGLDLDDCIDGKELLPEARRLVEKLGSYSERSPGGKGLHAVFIHEGFHRWEFAHPVQWGEGKSGRYELYLKRHFLTFTGLPFPPAPGPCPVQLVPTDVLASLQAEAERLKSKPTPAPKPPSPSRARIVETFPRRLSDRELLDVHHRDCDFQRYWNGDPGRLSDPTRSGIRFALLQKFAFTCGDDVKRAQALAESSPFYASLDREGKRDWARRFEADYRKATQYNPDRYGEGPRHEPKPRNSELAKHNASLSGGTPDLLKFMRNDVGNGERLLALHQHDLRYCAPFKNWLVSDGCRWKKDESVESRHVAKTTILEYLRQAIEARDEANEKFARACLKLKPIRDMMTLVEHEFRIAPSDLDSDPWLLNFQNGTVDLRTGELRPHRNEDFITKLIHYDYKPDAPCVGFLQFLERIMGGGPQADEAAKKRAGAFINYLQRSFGYSLTGVTSEKVLFIVFGEGNNGKSTLLTLFRELLTEYAVLLQVDTLMTRQETNNAQADLADLRGARFVQTSESEQGQRLAQGKLKRITQGMGTIKAVRKYENPIEFVETHKLWIDTNRKPIIHDTDDHALFNRFHLIPFTVQIPAEEIDKELPNKLLCEAEGILAWAVEGARLWFESGLQKPNEVDEAKKAYHDEMDQIGRFLEECCQLDSTLNIPAADLYQAYKSWTDINGERHITANALGRKMTSRNFERKLTEDGPCYQGIGIKSNSIRREIRHDRKF